MKITKEERADAVRRLKKILRPGDTVWTVLRHTSRSGMYRAIDLYVFRGKGRDADCYWLSRLAARAGDFRFDERYEAIGMGGCGMDMGFHLVYSLGRVLFPKGGPKSKSQRHFGPYHGTDKAPKRETDGGYLLRHRWVG